MKNHKILSIQDRYSAFGRKCFTKEQHDLLISLGYRYDEFFNKYEKTYSNELCVYSSLNVQIPLGKEFFYYYDDSFSTLAELNEKHYKGVMKELRSDIREMKKVDITR